MTSSIVWPFLLSASRLLPLLALPGVALFAQIPVIVRLGLLATTATVMAYATPVVAKIPESSLAAIFALCGELLLGLTLAFGIHLVFGALRFMGRLVDMQIGFAAAGVVDPTTQHVEALLGSAMAFTALVLLFAWDLHHDLIRGIALSLQLIPLGQSVALPSPAWLAALVGQQFLFALLLVSPIVVGLFLLDVVIAYASRLMPQVNTYFIALPLKIGVGLLLAAATFRTFAEPLRRLFDSATSAWIPVISGG